MSDLEPAETSDTKPSKMRGTELPKKAQKGESSKAVATGSIAADFPFDGN
jgi:hypothetical protein